MSKLLNLVSDFIRWVYLIIKKWVWVIGLPLPVLNLLSLYVPGFPKFNISWQLSFGVGIFGFIISTFLVYREQKLHLDTFFDNAPRYDFEVTDLSQKICEGDKIHIECNVRIICKTVWIGVLENVSLEAINLPGFIGRGEITNKNYKPLDWHCPNPLKLPYEIPQNGVDIGLEIHYLFEEKTKLAPKGLRRGSKVTLCFLIGYSTPELGLVNKREPVQLSLDFKNTAEIIMKHQEEKHQKELSL